MPIPTPCVSAGIPIEKLPIPPQIFTPLKFGGYLRRPSLRLVPIDDEHVDRLRLSTKLSNNGVAIAVCVRIVANPDNFRISPETPSQLSNRNNLRSRIQTPQVIRIAYNDGVPPLPGKNYH